jgi:hypothetical protein
MRRLTFFSALTLGSVAFLLAGSTPANGCNFRFWRSYYVEYAPIQYTYVSIPPMTMGQTANRAATPMESTEPITQASFQSIITGPKLPITDSRRQLERLSEGGNNNFRESGR